MDNVRIAILSAYDNVCAYLDNRAPKALHYYDDELHEYLKGSANTYTFKANAKHMDAEYLVEGNKLAFRYNGRDYYFNIVQVIKNEVEVEITAYSLNFELLNEQKDAYAAANTMTFAQYMDTFDFEKVVTLGINEVSNKSIKSEWTGTDTMLARLYSLATVFDAELEFVPKLNDDYSLNSIAMNVYQAHSDTVQGVGKDRTELVLRYGKDVSGITKTSDIAGLYTAIRPIGRDGLTVSSLNKTEYDADGNVEYTSPSGNRNIYAVQARDRFPSNTTANVNERYIAQVWNYDTDNVNMLYGQALAELKKNCVPQVKYEVDGYFDTGIGDTVSIADQEWNPPLYLQARVTEQIRSFTDPSRNKTTFDNFKELQSQIDPSLLAAMNALIEANKVYTSSILSNNGIVFKNGQGSTTLTASVTDVGKDMTDDLTIRWYQDGVYLATGKSINITASAVVDGKSVFGFQATDSGGAIRGAYEVTVSNVNDGADGEPGPPGEKGETGETGPKGNDGAQGPPTGVTVSSTEPASKFTGMLWQHTGTVAGLIKNATYRWTGSAWTLYKFRADNIEADSLSAITADLGTVTAGGINVTHVTPIPGANRTNTLRTVVSANFEGDIVPLFVESKTVDNSTGNVISQAGTSYDAYGIYSTEEETEYNPHTGLVQVSPSGIRFEINGTQYEWLPNALNGKAPTSHASTGTGYGLGNTANYGHVKLVNGLTTSTYEEGQALSAYQGYVLNSKIPITRYGRTGSITVAAGSYTDTGITYSGFSSTPQVFLTFYAGSQNTKYLGLAYFNDSATGCTIRVTNSGTTGYTVLVNWLAIL